MENYEAAAKTLASSCAMTGILPIADEDNLEVPSSRKSSKKFYMLLKYSFKNRKFKKSVFYIINKKFSDVTSWRQCITTRLLIKRQSHNHITKLGYFLKTLTSK